MRVIKQKPRSGGLVKGTYYPFHRLRHGDAIEVDNVHSAAVLFRRWLKKNGQKARLIRSKEHRSRLIFIDETPV